MLKLIFQICLVFGFTFAAYSQELTIIKSEFLFSSAPFPSCHASTIVETPAGLAAAFFGGSAESKPDVSIWVCLYNGMSWSAPEEAANGIQADGLRFPCWNPVLYQVKKGPLMLFYKVGPSPSQWWGEVKKSDDGGKSWGKSQRLPDGFMGPVKNKPVMLSNGTLLCPSSTENAGWQIQMERTPDLGKSWDKSAPGRSERKFSAIQPSVLFHSGGKLQLLCRTREGCIAESWSDDNGITWSPLAATSLPNPNSGIDAVTLNNKLHLLVYNPTTTSQSGRSGPRTPLSVALSEDGKIWKDVLTLESEEGEYSYPSVIQDSGGLVHITYTWKRKLIKHVVIKLD